MINIFVLLPRYFILKKFFAQLLSTFEGRLLRDDNERMLKMKVVAPGLSESGVLLMYLMMSLGSFSNWVLMKPSTSRTMSELLRKVLTFWHTDGMPFVATGENLKEDVSVKDGLCLGLVLLPTLEKLEVDVRVKDGICLGLVLLSIH